MKQINGGEMMLKSQIFISCCECKRCFWHDLCSWRSWAAAAQMKIHDKSSCEEHVQVISDYRGSSPMDCGLVRGWPLTSRLRSSVRWPAVQPEWSAQLSIDPQCCFPSQKWAKAFIKSSCEFINRLFTLQHFISQTWCMKWSIIKLRATSKCRK